MTQPKDSSRSLKAFRTNANPKISKLRRVSKSFAASTVRLATSIAVLLIVLFSGVLRNVQSQQSAPGSLDTTFGTGGQVTTNFFNFSDPLDESFGVTVQPDGKTVAVGTVLTQNENPDAFDFALARYNTDGTLDT
ncbi:MAG TPA: delta-60 repeat domain-containing protein, partial [Blastocatellia bacterium]